MAKFNIEVELDWIGDYGSEGASIDGEIQQAVIDGIQEKITKNAEKKIEKEIAIKIADISEKLIEDFTEKIMSEKLENLQIPYKKNGWGTDIEYIPISEYIGIQYEKQMNIKKLDKHGNKSSYDRDAVLSINEYLVQNYLAKELTGKVSGMIQTARKDAEETIVKALEGNLKEQLSSDIIDRLNIPKMLESLQNKSLEFEEG